MTAENLEILASSEAEQSVTAGCPCPSAPKPWRLYATA